MKKADLLRAEAAVADLEEAYDALKKQRPRCESCGRLKVTGGRSKLDEKIRKAGADLFAARSKFREKRNAGKP